MTLKEWAEIRGLKNKDLARIIGVNESTSWRWLEGKNAPSPQMIAKLETLTDGAVTYRDWHHIRAKPE